jgi:hypothetical protein
MFFQMFGQHGGNNSLIGSAVLRQLQVKRVFDLKGYTVTMPEDAKQLI